MPRLADHILGMPASGVRHILEQALRLEDVLILAVGEPGGEAAPAIREAAARAWRDGLLRYSPNGGIPSLRKAIVDKLAAVNDVHVDLEQVWVTVGATQA